jgi:hypothetical protein
MIWVIPGSTRLINKRNARMAREGAVDREWEATAESTRGYSKPWVDYWLPRSGDRVDGVPAAVIRQQRRAKTSKKTTSRERNAYSRTGSMTGKQQEFRADCKVLEEQERLMIEEVVCDEPTMAGKARNRWQESSGRTTTRNGSTFGG